MWQQWLSAVLGLWVLAVPFIGIANTASSNALTWTLAISGLVIAILGVWGAVDTQSTTEYRQRTT